MRLIEHGTIPRKKIKRIQKYKQYSLPITPVEKKLIAHDMEYNGQKEPVQLDEKFNLLDGFLRDDLLGERKIVVIKYEQYKFKDEAEKITHILTLNRMRRHYTEYQKCQMALPLYKEEQKLAKKRQHAGKTLRSGERKGEATELAAKEAGTSKETFKRFLDIQKSPELEKYEPALIKGDKKIKTVHVLVTRKQRNLPKVPLPKEQSDVFLTDVPYQYNDKGGRAAAEEHYQTMPIQEIVRDFRTLAAADNAIIFFWMSPSIQYYEIDEEYSAEADNGKIVKIRIGIPVYKFILDAAGFKVKAEFVWDKEKIGVGSYNRNQHENLLLAIKGDMPIPAELFSSIIKQFRSAHSRKPNLWPMIKKMYPGRNYCELYAREQTEGVLCHGNEVKGGKTAVS